MDMPKPSPETVRLFESVAPGGPEGETRKMFGQLAGFVHGNMFMGLFGDEFQVRLGKDDQLALLALGGQPFAPMGRVMKEYMLLPASILADRVQLESWVEKAYAFASVLPPKEPKPRAPKKRQ